MFSDLRHEQTRQVVDVEQVFETYRAARRERDARFAGAMSWKSVGGREYLYRKAGGVWKSLGPRGPGTEGSYAAFHEGRRRVDERLAALARRLDEMAPVNRALALGRMPRLVARVLRALDGAGLIGSPIEVVGTNALFVYERLCGVHVGSGHLATGDVDLLFDARARLKIAASDPVAASGLTGLLRKIDRSFEPASRGSYRAVNRDGFMVDLIMPMARHPLTTPSRDRIGSADDDLRAVEIEGLAWLVNSPKVHATVLDEVGYPLRVTTPDPRAFALHKVWLARRPDRDPLKAGRDDAQARLVAELVATRLPHLRFDDEALRALPASVRDAAAAILPSIAPTGDAERDMALEPKW